MDNTNRFLVVRDTGGDIRTEAYFAHSLLEAKCRAQDQAATSENGAGRWLVCAVLDEGSEGAQP